jgi:hypothetical protein
MPINIRGLAPLLQVFDMPTAVHLYVTDPDGYGLCFQWPANQKTQDQWKAWYGLE